MKEQQVRLSFMKESDRPGIPKSSTSEGQELTREGTQRNYYGGQKITDRRFLFRPPIPVKITGILRKTPEFWENGHNDFPA